MMNERLKPGLFCSSSLTRPIAMLPKNVAMHSKFSELLMYLIQFCTLEGVGNGTDTCKLELHWPHSQGSSSYSY